MSGIIQMVIIQELLVCAVYENRFALLDIYPKAKLHI